MIAEQLAQGLLVIRNAMLLNEGEEILWRVTSERRLGKVRIARQEVFRAAVDIGEIAAAAAGDENFLSRPLGKIEDGDAPSSFACFNGAHQSCCACA